MTDVFKNVLTLQRRNAEHTSVMFLGQVANDTGLAEQEMLSGTTFAERHLNSCARHEAGTLMSILRGDVQSQVGECQLSVSVRTKRSR